MSPVQEGPYAFALQHMQQANITQTSSQSVHPYHVAHKQATAALVWRLQVHEAPTICAAN